MSQIKYFYFSNLYLGSSNKINEYKYNYRAFFIYFQLITLDFKLVVKGQVLFFSICLTTIFYISTQVVRVLTLDV